MGGGCTKTKDIQILTQQYNKTMFQFKKVIGKGGFGRVWKVTEKKSRKTFAMKVMDKAKIITKKSVHSVLNQRQILCRLQHPFIVNMHCSFQDRQNLYLLIDFLESGDLRYYIHCKYNFKEEQVKFLVRCVMEGLKGLHDNSIIHRDIKPQNIIFDKNGYCRITDLGIARYWKSQNSYETSGTPGYMAPEVLLRQNHSFCVDYFAVGIIAYELLVGKRPYAGKDRKQIRDEMLAREAKIPATCTSISPEGIDFINKMIQRQVKKRLGYNGIEEIFEHPWLKIKPKQLKQFREQRAPSPITPLQVHYHSSLQVMTQPDDIWRQNILLLKRPETQNMFADYDFSYENRRQMQSFFSTYGQSTEADKLTNKEREPPVEAEQAGKQAQLIGGVDMQDISYMSTRRSSRVSRT